MFANFNLNQLNSRPIPCIAQPRLSHIKDELRKLFTACGFHHNEINRAKAMPFTIPLNLGIIQ